MSARARSRWGWGFEDAAIDPRAAAPAIAAALGFELDGVVEDPVAPELPRIAPPRIAPPAGRLAAVCSTDRAERAAHARGCSYVDLVRSLRGRCEHPPDVVARPRDERDVEELLAWASAANVAVIPYGGGTSVVGGVEARIPARFDGALALDVGALDALHEVDPVSLAARIGAGARGPLLEQRLRAHGLTMRFYPQSFELSTLGGWIATRAGGHFATRLTHVDDLVESVRALTPSGAWASRRLPGSGAGPSPDRLLLGSEGVLGVITEAWVRVQRRPEARAARAVRFPSLSSGADAVRAVVQSGLAPAACRLVDELEALQAGAGDGSRAVLALGFEAAGRAVDGELRAALAICGEHGGEWDEPTGAAGALASWRSAFLRMPYLRDALVRLGVLVETFETAVTWDRFGALREQVTVAVREALGEPCRVTCRITHVYPDGPAPYFTVLATARRGEELERWAAMKHAAGEAILAAGGTITHHHAVGRDHRPWYDRQRPAPFAAALVAAKAAVDPAGILNPGVLVGAAVPSAA